MEEKPLKIAVIGTGAAGLTAAHLLQQKHAVTLFERNGQAGGHVHTVHLDHGPDKGIPVDLGFTFFNDQASPLFQRLLTRLNVPVEDSQLSFGYYDEKSRLQYAGTNLNGLFAQRSNLWNHSFLAFFPAMAHFRRSLLRDYQNGKLWDVSLGQFLEEGGYSRDFIRHHLFPLGAAIWLIPTKDLVDFPADIFAGYLEANGFPGFSRPLSCKSVEGGGQTYVKALLKGLRGRVKTDCQVDQVERLPDGVVIRMKDSQSYTFDKVVLAVHADEALQMLQEPTEDETRLLSPWRYAKNFAVLHTDVDVMPSLKRAWASWNYVREIDATLSEPASVTWHVNRIQKMSTQEQYFVTFNRVRPIPVHHVLKEMYFTHPLFSREAVETQRDLPGLNGVHHTYFCGSYFGRGFHEDAVKSGLDVARSFGLEL